MGRSCTLGCEKKEYKNNWDIYLLPIKATASVEIEFHSIKFSQTDSLLKNLIEYDASETNDGDRVSLRNVEFYKGLREKTSFSSFSVKTSKHATLNLLLSRQKSALIFFFSSYRAVNIARLRYKYHSVKAV